MDGRAQRALSSVIGLALFLAALVALWHQLSGVTWRALLADVAATPPKALLLALLLTSLSYITLSGYDFVAMSYIRKSLPRAHVGWVSFLAYAVANNVGCAALSGASVRYRFYTRWGLTAEDLSLVVLSNSVACWLGLRMLGGVSLVSAPHAVATLPWPRWTVPVGWLFIGVAVAYVILVAIWRAPVRVRASPSRRHACHWRSRSSRCPRSIGHWRQRCSTSFFRRAQRPSSTCLPRFSWRSFLVLPVTFPVALASSKGSSSSGSRRSWPPRSSCRRSSSTARSTTPCR